MQHSKIIKGIDIGSSKVTTIIGQYFRNEDKFNVVAVSSMPSKGFRKGQIIDLETASQTIVKSVESAERMAGFQINDASVAISAPYIESLNSQGIVAVSNSGGEISENDVNRAIIAAKAITLPTGKEILHVIPRIFTVDGQEGITDPIGMTGVRLELEAHIILASSPALKNLEKCFNHMGLNITQLSYSGLSSAQSCLNPSEKELGVALVDIGGTTTNIIIYCQNSPAFSKVLPIGADNITNDLAIGLRLPIQDAENIKLGLKKIIKNKDFQDETDLSQFDIKTNSNRKISIQTAITGIIKPRLEEIFSMVYQQIENSGLQSSVPSGVVLTGGGSQTILTEELCEKNIPLPHRIANSPKVGGIIDNILTPSFTSSIGLLMYAQQQEQKPDSASKSKLSFSSFTARIKNLLGPLLP
ncbi:cell division protein FtsA [Patescibacteria group bacterium]|nr:cell division protein FtsA [Patescibacteria group bacterium]